LTCGSIQPPAALANQTCIHASVAGYAQAMPVYNSRAGWASQSGMATNGA
jgi:hypothetical protein